MCKKKTYVFLADYFVTNLSSYTCIHILWNLFSVSVKGGYNLVDIYLRMMMYLVAVFIGGVMVHPS